jgi:hypothetical protein
LTEKELFIGLGYGIKNKKFGNFIPWKRREYNASEKEREDPTHDHSYIGVSIGISANLTGVQTKDVGPSPRKKRRMTKHQRPLSSTAATTLSLPADYVCCDYVSEPRNQNSGINFKR